jgi:predicted metalloprotease with PDZ domain
MINLKIRLHRFLPLILVFAPIWAAGQSSTRFSPIHYYLSTPQPKNHLFQVKIEVGVAEGVDSIEFQMPKWSPGRYAVFDFARNVQEFSAAAGVCPLNTKCKLPTAATKRIDDQTWRVETRGVSGITVSYAVFGNDLSGTFSQLNEKHANFNGGSIFMYIVGHKPDPVSLDISAPPGWRITNGRMENPNQSSWTFPNYDVLIDTPTEISPDWTEDKFTVGEKRYRVVVHSLGEEGGKRSSLVSDIRKIVEAETTMWGPPEFSSYTFLIHFANDGRSSDGMEHLTSTQIIEPGSLNQADQYQDALDAVSHEFFHVWNVKRLRPVGLGPWDFTRDLRTEGLWVAEGFTNYYGHLMLRRAGIWSDQQLLSEFGRVVSRIENSQGSHLMSAVESSLSAPFIDGAESEQQTNLANTSVSYYYKGETIALVLDGLIRKQTNGKASLDDVMRQMYDEFYLNSPNDSYYLKGRAYTVDDVQRVASRVSGVNLDDFFRRYVWGVERLPYEDALSGVGLRFSKSTSGRIVLGINFDAAGELSVQSVTGGSIADKAGLSAGDQLVSLGGTKLTRANLNSTLSRSKPGETVVLSVRRDNRLVELPLKIRSVAADYTLEEVQEVPSAVREGRTAWLTGKR